MSTTKPNTSNASAAAEPPADGTTTPSPVQPLSPTITHYQQRATEFMAALEQIASTIPQFEPTQFSTEKFVRSRQGVSIAFLATATASVEQTPELQVVKKLDVVAARDTLQFMDAFRSVLDKVSAFQKNLRFTLNARKAALTSEALQIYDIGKGLARDPKSTAVAAAVANMKRDLGRRGPKTPKDRDDSEPRG